jgi:hypothetical protein
VKVVPPSGALSTATWPPLWRAMPSTDERSTFRPPAAPPAGGANIRAMASESGPGPVWLTSRVTYDPGRSPGLLAASAPSTWTRPVRRWSLPPPGIEARPWAPSWMRICSSWPGSASTGSRPSSSSWLTSTAVPTTWRMALNMPVMSWFRSRDRGARCGRRLKVRRWRERVAARSAASRIRARSSRASGASEPSSSSRVTWPRMPVSRLLKSWAMPPASWTISLVRPTSVSRCSRARRSVTSVAQPL